LSPRLFGGGVIRTGATTSATGVKKYEVLMEIVCRPVLSWSPKHHVKRIFTRECYTIRIFRTSSGVLPVQERNALKNELGSSKPRRNDISVPESSGSLR
jgi:hypothetical protein